ncbi:MAG TPA: response regulator [Flavobacterium sp.]|jgi:response regulator RpfG family c-di-GMP phosphodiesterase
MPTPILFYLDDDRDDLLFFKDVVGEIGMEVQLFQLGTDLLQATSVPIKSSIIFLDLNMLHQSGYEIMAELKLVPTLKDCPIVIYSTASDKYTINKCRRLGASLYLIKPTSTGVLKIALQNILQIDWTSFKSDDNNFVIKGE